MLVLLALPALLASPVWLIAVVVKVLSAALPGRRPDWALDLLRWCAVMAAVAAVGLYLIGLGAVDYAAHESESGADSTPSPSCRDVPRDVREHLVGYRPSHLPLGFDCVLDDGTTYSGSGVYTWMNALVAAFGLGAAALTVAWGCATERRARAVSPAPPPAPRP
ncbi:hypothetical protein ACWEWI_03125 [Streptomyces sp. NPDC003753]|uniref:hypothetical protein n=1 Tax=unclassified Streptomyces TaxID=2593676 RepID=UPI001902F548|nr:hypothetical protein [Streptomyces sp. Y2F8-2]GHJ98648.1 hypothetical protein SY2F82_04460 [Streptomyces sp. Y2F8-2]